MVQFDPVIQKTVLDNKLYSIDSIAGLAAPTPGSDVRFVFPSDGRLSPGFEPETLLKAFREHQLQAAQIECRTPRAGLMFLYLEIGTIRCVRPFKCLGQSHIFVGYHVVVVLILSVGRCN